MTHDLKHNLTIFSKVETIFHDAQYTDNEWGDEHHRREQHRRR